MCIHIVTLYCQSHPLHDFELDQPKDCFSGTWRVHGLDIIFTTQSASGHAALEVKTALESYAPHS